MGYPLFLSGKYLTLGLFELPGYPNRNYDIKNIPQYFHKSLIALLFNIDQLHLAAEFDFVAKNDTASFGNRVPGQTKFLSANLPCNAEAGFGLFIGVDNDPAE